MNMDQPIETAINDGGWIEGNIDAFAQEHKDLENLQQSISDGIDRQECISILQKFEDSEDLFSKKEGIHEYRAVAIVGVQAALHHLGYARVGEIDGIWGGKTEAAVKHFQEIAPSESLPHPSAHPGSFPREAIRGLGW